MTSSTQEQEQRVAGVLQEILSGLRQRQAEQATGGAADNALTEKLLAVRAAEFVREPTPVSPRRTLGGLVVWTRKAWFHLFQKWLIRPTVEQQNAANYAVARLGEELVSEQIRYADRLRRVEERLREVELRLAESEAGRPQSAPLP